MRTSASQFEMLVTFMEQHGDLSKLSTSNARGRITSIQQWEELTALLNSDGAGATKTTERWKKAILIQLGQARLSQDQPTQSQFEEFSQPNVETQIDINDTAPQSPSLLMRSIPSPTLMFVEQEVQSSQHTSNEPGPSRTSIAPTHSPPRPATAATQLPLVEIQVEGMLSPTRHSSLDRVIQPEPATAVQTTPRRTRSRTRGTPRRRGVERARPAHTEQAAQHFLQADAFWRSFKEQQHRDQTRIREMEIEAQREWQAIGRRALNLLERVVDKFCRE